jgi:hypothetical protein
MGENLEIGGPTIKYRVGLNGNEYSLFSTSVFLPLNGYRI